jgi:glycosyltransferase involved in cell wall biosynthesis
VTDVVVDGENGVLCDLNQPDSFSAAIARIVGDRGQLQAMQQASCRLAPTFDEGHMIDSYEALLNTIAKGRTTP